MEQKKFMDIVRYGHRDTHGVLNEGDYIAIMEKLDGANASFCLSEDGKEVLAFSRNRQLDEENDLRGFYWWVKENINPNSILSGHIYFGEWLVKHKVDYGINGGQQFYLFDVFSVEENEYLPISFVVREAYRIKLQLAPILYAGPYRGYDHLSQFVNRSALAENGEGIVVKNYDYRDRYGKQLFIKLVTDKFVEIQPRHQNQPSGQEGQYIKTFMTSARVEKLLLKLVDEGILDEQFGIEDMGTILRNLGTRVYDDILKEETPPQDFDEKAARRAIGKHLPLMVKEIINDRNK